MNSSAIKSCQKTGHEFLDDESAAMMIMGLKNQIRITLEGADVVRGVHEKLGPITVITPAAGNCCLLYPFEENSVF